MKFKIFIISVFVILISCKSSNTHVGDKNTNYIPYYLKVDEAKKLYDTKEFEKCFTVLDDLFYNYKPLNSLFINEMEIYCDLALKFNKKGRIRKICKSLISNYGFEIENNNDSIWVLIKKEIKFSNKKFQTLRSNYEKKINLNFRDSLISLINKDKEDRINNTKDKIDSLDRLKESKIVNLIKRNGYPTYSKVGGYSKNDSYNPAYISVLLKHISLKRLLIIEPILLKELKKGNCPPIVYASMLDIRKMVAKEITPFEYYGTIKNIIPTDTIKTNNARENIGLPRLNF